MNPRGYNPMRWKCDERGCYNVKHRPKIEQFAGCFPRAIGMTDVDATVEINGRFLFLEWKGQGVETVPTGQRIYFERLTALSSNITAVIVSGDPETMTVRAVQVVRNGKFGPWEITNADDFKGRVHAWASRASRSPRKAA